MPSESCQWQANATWVLTLISYGAVNAIWPNIIIKVIFHLGCSRPGMSSRLQRTNLCEERMWLFRNILESRGHTLEAWRRISLDINFKFSDSRCWAIWALIAFLLGSRKYILWEMKKDSSLMPLKITEIQTNCQSSWVGFFMHIPHRWAWCQTLGFYFTANTFFNVVILLIDSATFAQV